ncbi:MAG: hypothetical protein DRP83_03005 [Planctomycetota bacterium]|nr:MAG: hypothetical protein DRP83_03005 [Planctomycetota bacterium]
MSKVISVIRGRGFLATMAMAVVFAGVIFLSLSQAGAADAQAKNAYLERRSKIQTTDADALYKLARWVWQKHPNDVDLLKNAKMDLREAMKIAPGHSRAKLLLRRVVAKIKIIESKAAAASPGRASGPGVSDKYLLSHRDILWIRLMEYKPERDKRVSIKFTNRALKRYCDSMRGSVEDNWDKIGKEKQFYKMPPWKRLAEILRNRPDDIELLQDIHITRDPRFMVEFRSKVWPVVKLQCGNANCHGGPKPAGGLKLFTTASKNEKVDYTNFIILSGFRKGGRAIIDRQKVEDSLLLQYGLNAKVSKRPHPQVGGADIRPAFMSTKSAPYRNIRRWITSLEGPMAPNYRLTYKPPFGMKLNTSGLPDMPPEPVKTKNDE